MRLKNINTIFFVEDKSSYLLFHFSMAPMEESQILEPIPLEN